jgi:hypothetical protein
MKISGFGQSVGFWGNDPYRQFVAEQTAQKILALNYSKCLSLGLPFYVYESLNPLPPNPDPRIVFCSCVKTTSQQADMRCLSCYGQKSIPGYLKYGYQSLWWPSIDTGWTLNNIQLETIYTPNRLTLAATALTGTATSTTLVVPTPPLGPWEAHADFAMRDGGLNSSISIQFQINGTGPFFDISALYMAAPTAGQTITWLVTMTRTATTVPSPTFEIIRARYPVVPIQPSTTYAPPRTDIPQGCIMIIKTWPQERFSRDPDGSQVNSTGQQYWTLPLNIFYPSIETDTPGCKLIQRHIIREATGVNTGDTYVVTPPMSYSVNFRTMTRQQFGTRLAVADSTTAQSGEISSRVW